MALKKFIRIFIAIVLLSFILYNLDFKEIINMFYKIDFLIFIPLFLYVPGLILSSMRLCLVLENKVSQRELFKVNWISAFFNNFLLSSIGGDSYKILKLKKRLGTKYVIESIFIDRIVGVFGLLILSCISSIIFYKKTGNFILVILPFLFLAIFFIFFLFYGNKKIRILKNLNLDFKLYKIKIFNIRIILNSMLYTALGAISLFFYYLMFDYSVNFFVIISFYCFIQIINMIPLSINALGIQEASYIFFFSLIGVPAEVSLSISILSRFVLVMQTSIGGLIYLFRDH